MSLEKLFRAEIEGDSACAISCTWKELMEKDLVWHLHLNSLHVDVPGRWLYALGFLEQNDLMDETWWNWMKLAVYM